METQVKRRVLKKPAEKIGQKYPTPAKTDALYKFYTSLLKQKPSSEMALKWCVEHGTVSNKVATSYALSLELKRKAKIK